MEVIPPPKKKGRFEQSEVDKMSEYFLHGNTNLDFIASILNRDKDNIRKKWSSILSNNEKKESSLKITPFDETEVFR